MTLIEKKIQEFEMRSAVFDSAEQSDRASRFEHFSAINRFEGLTPSAIDKRLFQLLAAGKISKQEYLELCLTDASRCCLMTESYWNPESDRYRYTDSPVLKNLPGIRKADVLDAFEQRATALRLDEMITAIADAPIDFAAWRTIHRILFQDIYDWAGYIRTIQIAKGDTVFAMPERIEAEAKRIFDRFGRENWTVLDRDQFISSVAYYFGELNVLHPFRDGNGRTQKLLFDEIARRCKYKIHWEKITIAAMLQAVIAAFQKQDYAPLEKLFGIALQNIPHVPR